MMLDLLALQDAGEALSPPRRALLLAGQATGPALAADEPVGRVHARLLRLHEELAGPTLEGTVACASCGATVEFGVECSELLGAEGDIVADPPPLDGVAWRPVSYDDLAVAADAPDGHQAVAAVLARCAPGHATGNRAGELRPALSEAMAAADPLAEIELDLTCPDCSVPVRAELDVPAFTWAQVVTQAQALLVEVDALARVYSWSEAEILALSGARRRRFVELATGGA
jgi:hypothetical protein